MSSLAWLYWAGSSKIVLHLWCVCVCSPLCKFLSTVVSVRVDVLVVCMWIYGLVCLWYVCGCMGWCVGGMYGLVCWWYVWVGVFVVCM